MECMRRLRNHTIFKHFSDSQLKGGYHNFKSKYREVKMWYNDSRIEFTDKDPNTIKELIRRKWEYFSIAEEIFKERRSFDSTYSYDNGLEMAAYEVVWDEDCNWKDSTVDVADCGSVPSYLQSNVKEEDTNNSDADVSSIALSPSGQPPVSNVTDSGNRTAALLKRSAVLKSSAAEALLCAQTERTAVQERKLEWEVKKWELQLRRDELNMKQQLKNQEDEIAFKRYRMEKEFEDKERTRTFEAEEREKERQFEREKMKHSLEMLKVQIELAKLQKQD